MTKNRWTAEEDNFLIQNTQKMDNKNLGLILNRTERSIHHRRQLFGLLKQPHIRHGLSKHPLYQLYYGRMQVCINKNAKEYHNYGDRGIKFLLPPVEEFILWAEQNGWKRGLEIDRIDNNGHYELSNIQFSTPKENSNNQRRTIYLTAFGETKSLMYWLEDPRCVPKNRNTLHNRFQQGWSHQKILTFPIRKKI